MDLRAKKTFGYKGRSEEKRAKFLKIIATKEPKNLVYIDESGIDNIELWILRERRAILCSKIWKENPTNQYGCVKFRAESLTRFEKQI